LRGRRFWGARRARDHPPPSNGHTDDSTIEGQFRHLDDE
jgi:hypothetical protein